MKTALIQGEASEVFAVKIVWRETFWMIVDPIQGSMGEATPRGGLLEAFNLSAAI